MVRVLLQSKEIIPEEKLSGFKNPHFCSIKPTDHLKTHHTKWPATYEELVAECTNLSDFSEEDKKEFMEKLPKRTYNSVDEVLAVLGWTGGAEGGTGGTTGGGTGGGQMGGGAM